MGECPPIGWETAMFVHSLAITNDTDFCFAAAPFLATYITSVCCRNTDTGRKMSVRYSGITVKFYQESFSYTMYNGQRLSKIPAEKSKFSSDLRETVMRRENESLLYRKTQKQFGSERMTALTALTGDFFMEFRLVICNFLFWVAGRLLSYLDASFPIWTHFSRKQWVMRKIGGKVGGAFLPFQKRWWCTPTFPKEMELLSLLISLECLVGIGERLECLEFRLVFNYGRGAVGRNDWRKRRVSTNQSFRWTTSSGWVRQPR